MRIPAYAVSLAGYACAVVIALSGQAGAETYVARLEPMNSSVTGSEAKGEAKFIIDGDKLTITVDAEGTSGGIMHLQHFHGFADGSKAASCPTADADANKDGIIDLIETESIAGTTMVPFHDDPVSLQIPSDTYPTASPRGAYRYEHSVSLKDLQDAFAKAFNGQGLDLDKRVVFVHGVFTDTKLPATVASLGDIPANITLPIACGKIEAAK